MTESERIPITVLTGFLGAGKTTLLNGLLRHPELRNTAVIVNEFGDIGLDHLLVRAADENVLLLDAGCLCCTINSSLRETLGDLWLGRVRNELSQFDRVLVETTGLAEPGPIMQAITRDPFVTDHYRLDGTVTCVDAVHVMQQLQRQVTAIMARGESIGDMGEVIDAKGLHLFPGLIDAHLHFGFADSDTEYASETFYAAQGGVTTAVAYFLSSESYAKLFAAARSECEAQSYIDFAFHFSACIEPHITEMEQYVRDYGVTSFKYFMNFKGEEGRYMGLDGTDDGFFYDLLVESTRIGRPMIVCHAENIEMVSRIRRRAQIAAMIASPPPE